MVGGKGRPLKVFLCHASGDKPTVRDLYKRLTLEGVDAWLDKEKLLPGQDWRREIPKAVQEADVVVVCLSNKSVTKEGYVQKEIKFALDIAEEKPEGAIFLIPARLEECTVPERLSRWQWVDLHEQNGFIQLLRSLKLRADTVGATVEPTSYVDSDKEAERRLDQFYTEGLAAFYTEDWEKACHRFQSILSEQPNHRNAAEKLAESERQRNLAKLYEQALGAIHSEDWQGVITLLEELTQRSVEYKDAVSLLRNARKQNQLKALYAEAVRLHAAQKWQAVVKVFEQISVIEPDFPDVNELLPSAQKEVAEIKKREELNSLYARSLREMDTGNWYEARRLLEQVHKSQTGFLETERLLKKVEDEISREDEKRKQNDQVNTLYEQAHGLTRSKKWRNALEKMEEIRKLDDHFPDADGIIEKAQKELAREEQEAERQNKLAAMYAEALRLLKEEKYQEALDKWQDVRALDPKYPDRQWLVRTAKKKLGGERKTAVVQSDGRSKSAGFPAWAQTHAGWLIPFVAIFWGFGRFAIEMLARKTNFLGMGDLGGGFWITEIVIGTFGLIYGLTVRYALFFLGITIDRKKAILLTAGWLAGFVLTPVIGFSFMDMTDQAWNIGYFLAGLIAGLVTALILWSAGAIPTVRQIFVFAAGIALSVYFGEQVSGAMIVNILSPGASYPLALGSMVAGVFSASILEYQVSKDSVSFAEKRSLVLLAALGFGLARFVELNLAGIFRVGVPGELTWGVAGALQGVIAALVLARTEKEWNWKSMTIFGVCWAVVYLVALWTFRKEAAPLISSMVFSLAPAISIVLSSMWTRRVRQWQIYALIFIGWMLAWMIGMGAADFVYPVFHGSSLRWVLRDALAGAIGLWITVDLLKPALTEKLSGTALEDERKSSDPARLLLIVFPSIAIIWTIWDFLRDWLNIWQAEFPSITQILFYIVLGGCYGAVVAYSLKKTIPNWSVRQSWVVIMGWVVGLTGALLARLVNIEFIAVVIAFCGLSVVAAIAWAVPSMTPIKLTLIFLCWAVSWNYGQELGGFLANPTADYAWLYVDAVTIVLGLLGTFAILERFSGRLIKLSLLLAVGMALGNYAGSVLARWFSASVLVENSLQYALFGFIGGAIFEAPSRDWKKILFRGGVWALALAVAGAAQILIFKGTLAALRSPILGLLFGFAFGLSTRKISVITLLGLVGPAIFTVAQINVARLFLTFLQGAIIRGALIGLAIGFVYACLTREEEKHEVTG